MADRIKEVWTTNLEEEMSYLRAAIEKYPFVAMVSPRCWTTHPRTELLLDEAGAIKRTELNLSRFYLAGHRVPGSRRTTDRLFSRVKRLPLPNTAV